VRVIESCIVDWHATPWLLIDTDDMEHECKKFTRDLRTLDKCIREWAPYVHIVGVLRELVASLRAITELQNPAITERHWMELMQLTKVSIIVGFRILWCVCVCVSFQMTERTNNGAGNLPAG